MRKQTLKTRIFSLEYQDNSYKKDRIPYKANLFKQKIN